MQSSGPHLSVFLYPYFHLCLVSAEVLGYSCFYDSPDPWWGTVYVSVATQSQRGVWWQCWLPVKVKPGGIMMEEKTLAWGWSLEGSAGDNRVKLCAKHSANPWAREWRGGLPYRRKSPQRLPFPLNPLIWEYWRVHPWSPMELLSNLLAVLNFYSFVSEVIWLKP